ncbi:MAG: rhamnogalacturonan acetylesterase [Pirellula sp.]
MSKIFANAFILAIFFGVFFQTALATLAFGQGANNRENGKWSPTQMEAIKGELPTLFVASDSTAATGGPTTRGWGAVLIDYFDTERINVINRAIVNAETLIAGMRALDSLKLNRLMSERGLAIKPIERQAHWGTFNPSTPKSPNGPNSPKREQVQPPASGESTPPPPRPDAPDYGVDRKGRRLRYPPGVEPGMQHRNYNAALPTLWLIGDSTVKEGRDNGLNGGRWGWGREIERYFDMARINVENQALGGTSSRSFITDGWWESVAEMIKPGDFVMIQFGHNDGGINSGTARIQARGTLPGAGDETQEMAATGGNSEMVHTYGWYLRKYIADIRAAGATPIVCSLIPRNSWQDGTMVRGRKDGYVGWAREAAQQSNAFFIDLNNIICETMDPLGKDFAVGALFRPDDHTHTTLLGAQLNAQCVVAGIKSLKDTLTLNKFLAPTAEPVETASAENVLAGTVTR